jgi:hypothetical protein
MLMVYGAAPDALNDLAHSIAISATSNVLITVGSVSRSGSAGTLLSITRASPLVVMQNCRLPASLPSAMGSASSDSGNLASWKTPFTL